MRVLCSLILALALAAPLASCGKKSGLDEPPDSTYPRQYPPAK